jgi:hypothetical protein
MGVVVAMHLTAVQKARLLLSLKSELIRALVGDEDEDEGEGEGEEDPEGEAVKYAVFDD